MPAPPKVVAFDVDATSLVSLQEALPGWQLEVVQGATAASLAGTWDPGAADLLVLGIRGNGSDSLKLCRFLGYCASSSDDFRQELGKLFEQGEGRQRPAPRTSAPLLVLVSPGQDNLVAAALEEGAHSCLVQPIHYKDVIQMLAHARAGNQPGRHTLSGEGAQRENPWRDEGGEA